LIWLSRLRLTPQKGQGPGWTAVAEHSGKDQGCGAGWRLAWHTRAHVADLNGYNADDPSLVFGMMPAERPLKATSHMGAFQHRLTDNHDAGASTAAAGRRGRPSGLLDGCGGIDLNGCRTAGSRDGAGSLRSRAKTSRSCTSPRQVPPLYPPCGPPTRTGQRRVLRSFHTVIWVSSRRVASARLEGLVASPLKCKLATPC
jgi:hypothetical protein